MSLEVHVTTRANLRPDPEFDAIRCIFYSLLNDVPGGKDQRKMSGVMIVDEDSAKMTDVIRLSQVIFHLIKYVVSVTFLCTGRDKLTKWLGKEVS